MIPVHIGSLGGIRPPAPESCGPPVELAECEQNRPRAPASESLGSGGLGISVIIT